MNGKTATDLRVKIFADGADKAGMLEMYAQPAHQGPHDQSDADAQGRHHRLRAFAREVLTAITDRPISFEVFSDDSTRWSARRCEIASWGENVYVKIPVTNTQGRAALPADPRRWRRTASSSTSPR